MIILVAKLFNYIEQNVNKSLIYYLFGELSYSLKKYPKAITYYQGYCNLNSENEYILLKLGNAYHRVHNYEAAVKIYEQAVKVNGDSFDVVSNLGLTYFFTKQFEK